MTVVGESPIIDVTNAVVATNFSKELTAVLPTGHDVFSMLAITPGVQVTAPDVGGSRAGLRAQFRVFGSTSQWNVIEGAIMASLQYEDPDVYEEVQVAGASKGADAPVGGSFNNFIVKSGGNDVHGLFFYDREPLDLQSSNLSPELEAQGVTNTSSVARYQSVHADVGGPIMRDKFWWFYAFRNLNSDNWTPGYYNTYTGQPEPVFTTLRNHATKLNYRLNSNHTLAYSAQYNTKSLPNSGPRRFVDSASTSLTDFPYWIQGATLTSILSNRSTLEVKWGEFGWKWWTQAGRRRDLTDGSRHAARTRRTQRAVHRPQPPHEHLGCLLADHVRRPGRQTTTFEWVTATCTKARPTAFLAPKDSIRTFWRGGFGTPAEIETYDTPFSFENEVTHQWAFINDTWTMGRFSFNGGVRLDSFKPYYEEQGKDGSGPYQDVGDLSGLRVPHAERIRASRLCRLRHVWHRSNRDQARVRPLLLQRRHDDQRQLDDGGIREPDGSHGQTLPLGWHAAVRAQPGQSPLDTGWRQSHAGSGSRAALHRRVRRRPRSAAHVGHRRCASTTSASSNATA